MESKVEDAAQTVPPMSQFEPLFHKMTRMAMRRAQARGMMVEAEDIQQELAFTYLHCRRKYNPNGGAKFMTFLFTACWRNLERYLFNMHEKFLVRGIRVSGDESPNSEVDGSLWDLLANSDATPDQLLEGEDLLEALLDDQQVQPITRGVLSALFTEPDIVHEQLDMLNRGVREARDAGHKEEGVRSRGYERASFAYMIQLFNLGPSQTRVIRRDIERAVERHFGAGVLHQ